MNTEMLLVCPTKARRALWLFPAALLAILAVGPSVLLSVAWWRHQASNEALGLCLAAASGIALAGYVGRDIYRLHTSRNSVLKDIALGVGAIAIFGALVALREAGLWMWSFAAADMFVVALLGSLFTITLVTERRKHVRVYAYARRFVFVRGGDA